MIGKLIGGIRRMNKMTVDLIKSVKLKESELGYILVGVAIVSGIIGVSKIRNGLQVEALEQAIRVAKLKEGLGV